MKCQPLFFHPLLPRPSPKKERKLCSNWSGLKGDVKGLLYLQLVEEGGMLVFLHFLHSFTFSLILFYFFSSPRSFVSFIPSSRDDPKWPSRIDVSLNRNSHRLVIHIEDLGRPVQHPGQITEEAQELNYALFAEEKYSSFSIVGPA